MLEGMFLGALLVCGRGFTALLSHPDPFSHLAHDADMPEPVTRRYPAQEPIIPNIGCRYHLAPTVELVHPALREMDWEKRAYVIRTAKSSTRRQMLVFNKFEAERARLNARPPHRFLSAGLSFLRHIRIG